MSRATLVTGFCAGKGNTERLKVALLDMYEDIDAYTFVQAMNNHKEVERAAKGVPLYVHSAGALAVADTYPSELHAWAPPLPATKRALVGRGAIVGARMHRRVHRSRDEFVAVAKFDASYLGEAAFHGIDNIRRLGEISRFDGVSTAVRMQRIGIPTSITYANEDAFFKLTREREMEALYANVNVFRIPGEHNDPLLRPVEFLADYFAKAA